MRTLTRSCAVLGGLVWLVRWLLDSQGVAPGAVSAAYWVGLILLVLGIYGTGASLASSEVPLLQAFTGVAVVVLAAGVVLVARESGPDIRVDGVAGGLVALVWLPMLRSRRPAAPRGAHAR